MHSTGIKIKKKIM